MASRERPKKFYITLERKTAAKDSSITGYTVSFDLPGLKEEAPEKVAPEKAEVESLEEGKSFKDVLNTFRSAMDGYANFIPLVTLDFARDMAYMMGFLNVKALAEGKGIRVDASPGKNTELFELDIEHYRECTIITERMEVSLEGAKHLPEVILIGLISVYDAMLGRLLRVVFGRHEEIIFTSEKSLKFSELSSYGSIEAAKNAIVDREIEAILRESHHAQFSWMERKFNMRLNEDLPDLADVLRSM